MKRQPATINSEHPDLAKMPDPLLSRELDWSANQVRRTSTALDWHIRQTMLYPHLIPDTPLWMLESDLNYHLTRWTAIIEEIRYRNDSLK